MARKEPEFSAFFSCCGSGFIFVVLGLNAWDEFMRGNHWQVISYFTLIAAFFSFVINLSEAEDSEPIGARLFHSNLHFLTLSVDIISCLSICLHKDFDFRKEHKDFRLDYYCLVRCASNFFPCLLQGLWMILSFMARSLTLASNKRLRGTTLYR